MLKILLFNILLAIKTARGEAHSPILSFCQWIGDKRRSRWLPQKRWPSASYNETGNVIRVPRQEVLTELNTNIKSHLKIFIVLNQFVRTDTNM